MCDGPDLFLCVLSVLFPPIGVWVKRGICSGDALINIALCCLGFLPGLLHSWYIISAYPDPGYEPVVQEERVYYIQAGSGPSQGYGTVTPHGQFPGQQSGSINHFAQPQGKASKSAPRAPQPQNGSASAGPAHSSNQDAPPPTYADAVKADNKVQHD